VNVVITIALWLEARRRPPQPKLKRKFVKQLLGISLEPITPKHQPPKTFSGGSKDQPFFDDFADFANVVNQGLAEEAAGGCKNCQRLASAYIATCSATGGADAPRPISKT
jgi:hypothetical protein